MTSEDKYALRVVLKTEKAYLWNFLERNTKHTGVVVVMFQGENRIL
jgi:hypothetical protein